MPFTRKAAKNGIIASYCDRCDSLVAATKSKPKRMLKLLDLMESIHHCRGAEEDFGENKGRRGR